MRSLVLELQGESLDENVPLKSLLRKAVVISQKLELDDLWPQCELYGFTKQDPPFYRVVNGQVVANVPGQGYIPVELPETLSSMDTFMLRQPIAELEAILGSKNNFAFIPLPTGLQISLRDIFSNNYMYSFRIPLSQIVSLLDTVRTQILNFTLRLEKEDILGNGMSFNIAEKDKVKSMVNLTVNGNFQGVLGDIQNSNVTQSFSNGIIEGDLNTLCEMLKQNKVSDTDIDALKIACEVDGDVVTIPDQYGPEVKSWFNKMMTKAIDGTWAISIGAAANLLASGLNKLYLGT